MNEAASLAPPAPACAGLTETEAQRLERHRQRLLHALQAQGKQKGVATLCIGGGEATAMAVGLV